MLLKYLILLVTISATKCCETLEDFFRNASACEIGGDFFADIINEDVCNIPAVKKDLKNHTPLLENLSPWVLIQLRMKNVDPDCIKVLEDFLALKQNADYYFDVVRRNANQDILNRLLPSILKISSAFHTVPEITVTTDVYTSCKISTSTRLQFPKKCPEKSWILSAVLGVGALLASGGSYAIALGASVLVNDVMFPAYEDLAGSGCSSDFRDSSATSSSTANCSSVTKTLTYVDQSLSPADRVSYYAYDMYKQLLTAFEEKRHIEKNVAYRNPYIFYKLASLNINDVLTPSTNMLEFERRLALRFFNSLFQVNRMYLLQSKNMTAACSEIGLNLNTVYERQIATQFCIDNYSRNGAFAISTNKSAIIYPQPWVSHIPSYSNSRWDIVRGLMSELFGSDFFLTRKPDRSFTQSGDKLQIINPGQIDIVVQAPKLDFNLTFFNYTSRKNETISILNFSRRCGIYKNIIECRKHDPVAHGQFALFMPFGVAYENTQVQYSPSAEYWSNHANNITMVNSVLWYTQDPPNLMSSTCSKNSCGETCDVKCKIVNRPKTTGCVINNMKDSNETDIDCGGSTCTPCKRKKHCRLDRDCLSNKCMNNICK